MYLLRSGSFAISVVMGCVIALGLATAPESTAATPDVESEVIFDASRIERIVPGTTAREEITDWFGAPDDELEFEDGTSHWVYRETREVASDATSAQNIVQAKRAANAKRFAENTKALARAGRKGVTTLFDWLDRTFRYPPRPIRQTHTSRAEPLAAVSSPSVDEAVGETDEAVIGEGNGESFEDAGTVDAREDVPTLARMELTIRFARDGVVDKFEYQRAAVRSE